MEKELLTNSSGVPLRLQPGDWVLNRKTKYYGKVTTAAEAYIASKDRSFIKLYEVGICLFAPPGMFVGFSYIPEN